MFGDTRLRRWFGCALLLWALAASRLALSAATVTGTIYGADGDLFTGTMLFRTLRTPLVSGSTLVTGGDYRVNLTNGALSTTLLAGDYRAFIGADQKGFIIAVPSGSSSYSILGLITNAITYTDQSYPWESTPPATASVSGTVKTDVDAGDPVVYLKSSIDALLAANKLDITNGAAVNLTGSLTNVTLWTTNDIRVGTAKAEALQLRNLQTGSRFWLYLTNADTSPQIVLTATPDTDDPTGLGASTLDDRLKAWTSGQAYQVTAATYDSDGVVTTATVSWPDGSAGTFTRVTKNTTFLAIDAFTITHAGSGKTVTQSAVTRDDFGAITVKPALTVS